MQRLLAALRGNQEQANRFFGLMVQTVAVPDFCAPENMERIFATAASAHA